MKNEIRLYSGWGIEPSVRNYGDTLCHNGGVALLSEEGVETITDVRSSIDPISNLWNNPLVIGGETVLPTVFEAWVGLGLTDSDPIVIFGSGVLSPSELTAKNIHLFDKKPYQKINVVGLRGPLSTIYYRKYFDQKVDYVGDLAFAFTSETPAYNPDGEVLFFIVENNLSSSRLQSSQAEIIKLYSHVANTKPLRNEIKTLCLTDRREIDSSSDAKTIYDKRADIGSLEDFLYRIQHAKFVFTDLHPAIVAASAGIPFIYLQTSSKSRDLHELLKDQITDGTFDNLFVDMTNMPDPSRLAYRYKDIVEDPTMPQALNRASRSIKERLQIGARQVANYLAETSTS